MVKILKGSTFSLSQKISKEDSIVWLKESNKYIVLNSKILQLIKNKSSLSSKDFLQEIYESLNVSIAIAMLTFKDSYISCKKSFEDRLDLFFINCNILEFKTIYLLDSFNHTIESSLEIF